MVVSAAGRVGGQSLKPDAPSNEDASLNPEFAQALKKAYESAAAAFTSGHAVEAAGQAETLRKLIVPPNSADAADALAVEKEKAAVRKYEDALKAAGVVQHEGWGGRQKESFLKDFSKQVEAAAKNLKMSESDRQYAVYYYLAKHDTDKPLTPDQYRQKLAQAQGQEKVSSVHKSAYDLARALGGAGNESVVEQLAHDPNYRQVATTRVYDVGDGKITSVTKKEYVQVDQTGRILRYGGVDSVDVRTSNRADTSHQKLDATIVPPPGTRPVATISNDRDGSYVAQREGRNGESEYERKQRESEERDRIAEAMYRKSSVGEADAFFKDNCNDKTNGMVARGLSCGESIGLNAIGLPKVWKSSGQYGVVMSNDDVTTGEKVKKGGKFAVATVESGATIGTAVYSAAEVTHIEDLHKAAKAAEEAATGKKIVEGLEGAEELNTTQKLAKVVSTAKKYPGQFAKKAAVALVVGKAKDKGTDLAIETTKEVVGLGDEAEK